MARKFHFAAIQWQTLPHVRWYWMRYWRTIKVICIAYSNWQIICLREVVSRGWVGASEQQEPILIEKCKQPSQNQNSLARIGQSVYTTQVRAYGATYQNIIYCQQPLMNNPGPSTSTHIPPADQFHALSKPGLDQAHSQGTLDGFPLFQGASLEAVYGFYDEDSGEFYACESLEEMQAAQVQLRYIQMLMAACQSALDDSSQATFFATSSSEQVTFLE